MTAPYGYENTIAKAAALENGRRLSCLYNICENQKTISTKRLLTIFEKMHDDNKQDAIHLRCLADKLQSEQPQWQPIETAPESGPFLVYGGMFRSELYADSKTREAVKVSGRAPYTMSHNKGEILFYVADADYHDVWVVNPTHWMPLPEAPQGEEK